MIITRYEIIKSNSLGYLSVSKRMRKYLDKHEPRIARLVHHFAGNTEGIRYKDLRQAVINGSITLNMIRTWLDDYSGLINTVLKPEWEKAVMDSINEIKEKYPLYAYDPFKSGTYDWTEKRSGELITNMADSQMNAVNEVIKYGINTGNFTVDELARALRPLIGLTRPQMNANMRYLNSLLNNGMSHKQAREKAFNYAARQHRQRADVIARNETAVAYRAGAQIGIKDAQRNGLMGIVVKDWFSARDGHVCPICVALDRDGQNVPFDAPFVIKSGKYKGRTAQDDKGAHVGCRCAVLYHEVE